ncbi:zinc ribbon domain-containing protein [Natrinema pallidum]|uniref:DZANK-type domain-containing protein n=1 Tax=Natrinema pallidum DSM 3751 TaxID=1227495 RepID=L9YZF0_9EURY|nr:hypothetical protein C487_08584 [Natrinema pallidum DSM 3751]
MSNSRRRVPWEDAVGCPHCGADIPASVDYCPACGDGLEQVPEPNGGIVCPECDAVAAKGSRYCPACGTRLAETGGSPS